MSRLRVDQILAAVLCSVFFGSVSGTLVSCKKQPEVKEETKESAAVEPSQKQEEDQAKKEDSQTGMTTEEFVSDAPKTIISELGEFGSGDPIERADMPQRGVICFKLTKENSNTVFMPGEHWEQYNFPFEATRWGRYRVKLNYKLKAPSLGVQLKVNEKRLKKQLKYTGDLSGMVYLGELDISDAGPYFMALYTPPGVGWSKFELLELALIPMGGNGETVQRDDDGALHLLAKDATTWSEKMRYEPKPEKDCLGFWTETEDFAEWEFKVDKAGKYQVIVHQGCGHSGGSQVEVELAGQSLEFKVQDTGGFQNWKPVPVGQVEISNAGVYRLSIKPKAKAKQDEAIMDVHKVVLVPMS